MCHFETNAQKNTYSFKQISLKDGLPSQLCINAIEDSIGNIWISGFKELHKYDGYNIKSFHSLNSDLTGNFIVNTNVDANGRIWVAESSNTERKLNIQNNYITIHVINPDDNSFSTLDEYIGLTSFQTSDVNKVYFRKEGIVLISDDKKIYKWTDRLEQIGQFNSFETFILPGNNGYYYNNQDSLYFSYYNNPKNPILLDKVDLSKNINAQSNKSGEGVFINKEQTPIFPGSIIYNDTTLISIDDIEYPESSFSANFSSFDMFYRVKLNGRFISKAGNKLFIEGDQEDILTTLGHKGVPVHSMNTTTTGYALVTTDNGLFIINTKPAQFKTFMTNNKLLNSTSGIIINQDFSCYLNGKEILVNPNNKHPWVENIPTIKNNFLVYETNNEGIFWGFGVINDKSRIRRINIDKESVDYLTIPYLTRPFDGLYYHDSSGCLYGYSKRIIKVDSLFSSYEVLSSYDKHFMDVPAICNHIEEHEKDLWFATDRGLLSYNTEEDKFIERLKTLNDEQFSFVHFDKKNDSIVWIATKAHGLNRWNKYTDSLYNYNSENGLSNNYVHAIHEDNNNRLWVSTNNNLNCIDKSLNEIFIYTTDEGLSHSEFNKKSYYFDEQTGDVYFGGLNGYTYFNPDDITNQKKPSKPRLIDALITKSDFLKENIIGALAKTNTIQFDEDVNHVTLELTTDDYLNIDNIEYQYRISGLSNQWYSLNKNTLELSKPPSGEYNLQIKSVLNNSLTDSEICTFLLIIPTPLQQRLGFLLFLLSLLILFAYLYSRWRINNIKRKNKALQLAIEERTIELKNANLSKNKLFTILAHDLRNPLSTLSSLGTKIDYLVSKNRFNEVSNLTQDVESKVRTLNDNLNNLLSWALHENGSLLNSPTELNLKSEVDELLQLYYQEATSKSINIDILLGKNQMIICDKTILQSILRNGLSNAIKFCPTNGKITINYIAEKESFIEIKNTADDLSNKSKENFGAGVGLKISRELCSIAGMQIELEKQNRGYTTFKLHLNQISN